MSEALRIPFAYRGHCELCGEDLDTRGKAVCQYTAGWVRNREGGGGHGLTSAIRYQRFAHFGCAQKEQKGLLEQGLLF